MKFVFLFCLLSIPGIVLSQQQGWKRVDGRIETEWAAKVDPKVVLPEYPRPQMVRKQWMNLNGLWNYALQPVDQSKPQKFENTILVPFPIESSLSGVGKNVGKDNKLWYRKSVQLPSDFKNKSVLLHFGAVDWQCEVFVNGTSVGKHEGGFDPFSFDITSHLRRGQQEIVVSVWDPSDDGPQPRGKQVKEPNSIWYTPVTGIWQTVWLEAVSNTYISGLRITPDLDSKQVSIAATTVNGTATDQLFVEVWSGSRKVAEGSQNLETVLTLTLPEIRPWSPDSPHLYDLKISLLRKGKRIDEVQSYFGMRKISMEKDSKGILRMKLNNEFAFQFGPLDQGWWPDGLYTAPTDEALKFDVLKTKEMGFNMIRKHVKVEPARWYYHCDKEGILVWQDMPSGDMGNRWDGRPGIVGLATDKQRSPESEAIFRKEWKAIMDAVMNAPSVVVWVPFNEAWGQFKTEEIVKWTEQYDPTRLVNGASGGNFTPAGDMIDLHNYPEPAMPDPKVYGEKQALVLGEYGGLGLPLEGHTWQSKDNWGYQSFKSLQELKDRYSTFIISLQDLIKRGLSAAVYTQTTDVEIEINGLMTYDRKVIKIPEAELHQIHMPLYQIKPE